MKPVHQLLKHDPDNGVWGDCFRAAIASVLELPVEAVPHLMDGGVDYEEGLTRLDAFLAPLGLCMVEIPIMPAADTSLEALLELLGAINGEFTYLLGGISRNGVGHVVVCQGGRIVHDPNPAETGIVAPHQMEPLGWFIDAGSRAG